MASKLAFLSCEGTKQPQKEMTITAAEILGNPAYQLFLMEDTELTTRGSTSLGQIKADLQILHAMGIACSNLQSSI